MNVVGRRTTPVTKQQMVDAIVAAWKREFGAEPSRPLATLVASLSWIETGGGNLNNYNPGNLTAGKQYTGNVWRPTWFNDPILPANATPTQVARFKRDLSLHGDMLKGTAPSAFRAYGDLTSGVQDWIHAIRVSFGELLDAGESGDANTFRVALSRKYSHDYANPASTATFASLQKTFAPLTVHLPEGRASRGGMILLLGLATSAAAYVWYVRKAKGRA